MMQPRSQRVRIEGKTKYETHYKMYARSCCEEKMLVCEKVLGRWRPPGGLGVSSPCMHGGQGCS